MEISNSVLSVRYDDKRGEFSVSDRATGRAFLSGGKLDGEPASALAKNQAIVVTERDGSSVSLELRGDLPFVFVTKSVMNSGGAELDLPKVAPVSFAIDLGKPADELRTMGTGGLLAPDKNPGSYLFLTCADPATRNGVVTGWVTEDRGSGVLFSEVADGKVRLKAHIDYGHLRIPAGKTERLETLALGYFNDARIGEEQYAGLVQSHYNIKLRPRSAVYCTWYADQHGGAGDEKSTVELSHFVAKELKPFGLDVIQIDDQWQDGLKNDGPARGFDRARPNGRYPHGIAPVAAEVNKDGLTLGLWWLPFGRNQSEPDWKDRQDWFAKWADGKPMHTRTFGGTCLDLTNPAVQEHLAGIAKLYREWGVKYFKMDGLWTGTATELVYINDGYKDDHMSNVAPFHDPSKTQIEAFRDGLKLLRKNAGDDVFFSGCCVSQNMRSFGGAIGLVDSMRIGPDFNHDGQGIKTGPIRASRLYFLNGRVWWNDPDPAKVRSSNAGGSADAGANGAVSEDMARMTTSFAAITGQFFLLSDWIPNLPPERIEILKRTMLSHNGTVRPVDYFDHSLPYVWLLTDTKSGQRRDVIGLFNWEKNPQTVGATLAKAGLAAGTTYYAYDFWKNELLPDINGSFEYELPPASCKVIAVRAAEGHPVLLSTSRHVTQGIVDVIREEWSGTTLSGVSEVIANDPNELRVRVPDGWEVAESSAPVVKTPGLARMVLKSSETRQVSWKISFHRVPQEVALPASNLKAIQPGVLQPVILSWTSNQPFFEISRDGAILEAGHYGLTYTDAGALPGRTYTYTVKSIGGTAAVTATVQTKAVEIGPVPPKPAVSLMTLKPLEIETGWGSVGIGKSAGGSPLQLGEDTFPDGIGLHANARAVYERKPEYKRFVAVIGIDEARRSERQSSLICKVLADDKVLAQTPVMKFGGVERWHFDVELPVSAKHVVLVVEDAGDGNKSDHADWVNAGFLSE